MEMLALGNVCSKMRQIMERGIFKGSEMITNHLIQVSVFAGLLALAGCTTPQETLAEEGYTSMTPAEISGLYSGNTVRTTNGSDYYAPDGSYVSSWKGTITGVSGVALSIATISQSHRRGNALQGYRAP